jgi:hypothetical protein
LKYQKIDWTMDASLKSIGIGKREQLVESAILAPYILLAIKRLPRILTRCLHIHIRRFFLITLKVAGEYSGITSAHSTGTRPIRSTQDVPHTNPRVESPWSLHWSPQRSTSWSASTICNVQPTAQCSGRGRREGSSGNAVKVKRRQSVRDY